MGFFERGVLKFIVKRLRSHLPTLPATIMLSDYAPKREMIQVPVRDGLTLDLMDRAGWWWVVAVVTEDGRAMPRGERVVHPLNIRTTANPDAIADAFFSYMMAILDALVDTTGEEAQTENPPSSQDQDNNGIDAAYLTNSIEETCGRVAAVLSQLPWLSVSYQPPHELTDRGTIRIRSPYSGESVALVVDDRWILWRPRSGNEPRFVHDLQTTSDFPPSFLGGQIANIESQDMFEIMRQGGDYIKANYPELGNATQHVPLFWHWLPGTLSTSEKLYQHSLDEMSAAYLDNFINRMNGLISD